MTHELTPQLLESFSRDFNADPKNQVISRAARRSGLLEAAYNPAVSQRLNRTFSIVWTLTMSPTSSNRAAAGSFQP